jgi:hypothetical protein
MNVGRPFPRNITSGCIKHTFTERKSPIDVMSVGNSSVRRLLSLYFTEFSWEKPH